MSIEYIFVNWIYFCSLSIFILNEYVSSRVVYSSKDDTVARVPNLNNSAQSCSQKVRVGFEPTIFCLLGWWAPYH